MSGQSAGRQPTPLPPLRYDWTGNDIDGIHALAGTVYGYVPPSLDVVNKLNGSVDELMRAVGWQGQAAESFRNAWERDSAEAVALTGLIDNGGEILDTLALELAWIQNEWESLDPDPQKAREMGRDSAQAKIAQALATAAQDLNSLSANKIASAARQDIQDGTIPAADRKALEDVLTLSLGTVPQQQSGPATDTRFFNSHTMKDAMGGTGFGTFVGTLVGGGIGLLGGPFAAVTIPAGALAGGTIGGAVGGTLGGLWGLGEDLHFW